METLLSPSTLFTPLRGSKKAALVSASSRSAVSCALKKPQQAALVAASHGDGAGGARNWVSFLHHGFAAAALSLAISLAPAPAPAVASEFDVLNDGPPVDSYVVDDAGVLSRVTKSDVKRLARDLEARKNIRLNFVTVRKLTSKADAFEYADQVLEKWYPTIEEGSNKGIVVLVTSQKEGAITGGPEFVKAVGDQVLDATVSENLPGGFCYKKATGATSHYCVPNAEFPCAPNKTYHERGPMQISYNHNYGLIGQGIGADLLRNPDLVATDPVVALKTALWVWMTPTKTASGKWNNQKLSSCHDAITGVCNTSSPQHQQAAGDLRVPGGYGLTTNILTGGGRQCAADAGRVRLYKRYCDILGVSYGPNLHCRHGQVPFGGNVERASSV